MNDSHPDKQLNQRQMQHKMAVVRWRNQGLVTFRSLRATESLHSLRQFRYISAPCFPQLRKANGSAADGDVRDTGLRAR